MAGKIPKEELEDLREAFARVGKVDPRQRMNVNATPFFIHALCVFQWFIYLIIVLIRVQLVAQHARKLNM